MNCIVTAGPTYEPLDDVRRLTNSSTGRLGTELANFLTTCGHHVTLLAGQLATYDGERRARRVETFSTTASLRELLRGLATEKVDAVFHAAAVSDFGFGKIWLRSPQGDLTQLKARKLSTREGTLLAELTPTPKIIAELRDWYPGARLVGWKYEADGKRPAAIAAGEAQMTQCLTDACVVNGPAYGEGFGLLTGSHKCTHLAAPAALFEELARLLKA